MRSARALPRSPFEAGKSEVLADAVSGQVRAGLAGGVAAHYPQLASA